MENKENQSIAAIDSSFSFNFYNKEQFEHLQRVALTYAYSDIVPDIFKVSKDNAEKKAVANCAVVLEMAARIGKNVSALAVMQNLTVIKGKPTLSSKFLIATINSYGKFNMLKFKFRNLGKVGNVNYTEYVYDEVAKKSRPVAKVFDGSNIDDIECIAWTTEKGSTDVIESSPITIKLAIQEGWYQKNGSKWKTMTQQMLRYRAASFWSNVNCPEVSMGMATEEEVIDTVDIAYEDVSEKNMSDNANKTPISMDSVSEGVAETVKEKSKGQTQSEAKPEEKAKEEANTTKPVEKKQATVEKKTESKTTTNQSGVMKKDKANF